MKTVFYNDTLLRSLGKNIARYYIYVVWGMSKDARLIEITPDTVFRNLETDVKLFIRQRVYNKLPIHKISGLKNIDDLPKT